MSRNGLGTSVDNAEQRALYSCVPPQHVVHVLVGPLDGGDFPLILDFEDGNNGT